MRIFALATAALAASAVTASGFAALKPTPAPTLSLTTSIDKLLVLRGRSFRPNERVRVLVVGTRPASVLVVTNAAGIFRVAVKTVAGRCLGLRIQAISASGRRASTTAGTTACTGPSRGGTGKTLPVVPTS